MIRKINPDYSIRSIDVVFDVLELILASESGHISLPHLCSQLHISRNKAFRLMATLEMRGMVERDQLSGTYRLGISAVGLSQKILNKSTIITYAHPVMEELAKKHDEAVYMTVLKDDEVMFLDMVDCRQKVKAAPLVGQRFPFFSNAAGKAIKALECRDTNSNVKRGRRRKAPCNLRLLESELDDIRKKGVAVDRNGLGDGIISVAVAVKDYAGKVVGAITMLAPSFRMLADRLETEIIPSLQEGAEMLSERFGYARG
ncbi:MAG: helix-turn-helix domain-containing protein [Geobacter sp.]|nr:helix-turn-helix domain-containing protein [Geobacter sp.]